MWRSHIREYMKYDPFLYESVKAKADILCRKDEGWMKDDNRERFYREYKVVNSKVWFHKNTCTFYDDCIKKVWDGCKPSRADQKAIKTGIIKAAYSGNPRLSIAAYNREANEVLPT